MTVIRLLIAKDEFAHFAFHFEGGCRRWGLPLAGGGFAGQLLHVMLEDVTLDDVK